MVLKSPRRDAPTSASGRAASHLRMRGAGPARVKPRARSAQPPEALTAVVKEAPPSQTPPNAEQQVLPPEPKALPPEPKAPPPELKALPPDILAALTTLDDRLCEALGTDAVPGVIVANKVDLRERLVVTRQQGQQMAASLNMAYFECSALDGVEIDAPFAELAKLLHGGGGGDSP